MDNNRQSEQAKELKGDDVKRYDIWMEGVSPEENETGDWVSYEDVEDALVRESDLQQKLDETRELLERVIAARDHGLSPNVNRFLELEIKDYLNQTSK
jgi:hypothetical protein